jgi:hypothetical protein
MIVGTCGQCGREMASEREYQVRVEDAHGLHHGSRTEGQQIDEMVSMVNARARQLQLEHTVPQRSLSSLNYIGRFGRHIGRLWDRHPNPAIRLLILFYALEVGTMVLMWQVFAFFTIGAVIALVWLLGHTFFVVRL